MLSEMFEFTYGDIISITGSGGKTSLMFYLANELSNSSVLVTTTTKIIQPEPNQYNYIYINEKIENIKSKRGISVVAKKLEKQDKLSSIAENELCYLTGLFDYTIIESDGSKKKSMKGWSDTEPVLLPQTTKTIGVINFNLLGKEINEENIHRHQIYKDNFANPTETTVNLNQLKNVILNKQGLFKNSVGQRILYINSIEDKNGLNNINNLFKLFSKEELSYISIIVFGSLKDRTFELFGH